VGPDPRRDDAGSRCANRKAMPPAGPAWIAPRVVSSLARCRFSGSECSGAGSPFGQVPPAIEKIE
jgi:hypothetical protein